MFLYLFFKKLQCIQEGFVVTIELSSFNQSSSIQHLSRFMQLVSGFKSLNFQGEVSLIVNHVGK